MSELDELRATLREYCAWLLDPTRGGTVIFRQDVAQHIRAILMGETSDESGLAGVRPA